MDSAWACVAPAVSTLTIGCPFRKAAVPGGCRPAVVGESAEKAFSQSVICFVSSHQQVRQPISAVPAGTDVASQGKDHMGRKSTTRRIGIADVAARAGVSHATV